jgi:TRAP-type C4-dicarboxylate transport system permease small subunit
LPYTTAVKGHVAVEYFFHKLGRTNRVVADTLVRLLGMGLFVLLGWGCFQRGIDQQAAGTTTATLEIPLFWTWYVTAGCCGLVVLTIFAHLIRPGRELIRP